MVCSRRMSFHLVYCVVLLLVIVTWREVSCSSSRSSSRRRTSAATFISNNRSSLVQEVLRAFKQAITSDPLHSLASWDVSNYSSNPCSWAGLQCDNNNLLTSITLSNKSLHGSISPQLALLPTLSILDLSFNNLSSSFPPSLPRSLSYLDFSHNSLSGTLPLSSISNLSSLQFVSLDYNSLHGPFLLPPSCFPQLQVLSIANNSFSGLLPPELPLCFSLKTLNFSHNFFTGPLFPRGLGNLTTLTQLDMGINHLHGPIPQGLGNCSMLQFLSLPGNNFSGSIPPSIGLGCRSLGFFSLFQNNGSGAIPPEIGLLSKLHYLSLGLNNFTGKILDVLANCSELSTLEMSRNLFTGDLPPDLGSQLPNLKQLNSEFTMFTGSIPASLGNCSGLTLLIMGFNKISGSIPDALFRCQQIIRMDLQFNSLTGGLPSQIRNLTFMQIMYLNNNRFKGSLPQELGMLASVQVVTFEHNFFSGNFPNQLFNCSALMRISVHNNRLQGRIPSSIGHLASFETFEAGNNLLTGPLPLGLSNCTKMRFLNLSNNLLTGEIQTSVVAGLVQFIFFDLSINNLSGPIPQIGNMIHLQTLDLSHNKLSGTVPSSLSGCVDLLSLNLSSNSLTGSIPDQLGQLTSLQQLDLSANSLSGTIPSTLAGIRTLLFLNLSYNSLEGTVPKGGVFNNLTSASFLGNPKLCGFPVNKTCAGNYSPHASSTKLEKIWLPVGALLLLGIGCFLFAVFRRKKASLTKSNSWDFSSPFLRLTLEDIQQATNNFSEENILGTGVTGTVYKGMMADGRTLAFKRFMPGNPAISSFIAELRSVGLIRHRNLIRILGYCSDQQDNNILILEYMPNRSLNDHLHIIPLEGKCRLSWEDRHRVATVVAQGLLYLHYDCPAPVIHCDLKPQNILFDADMEVHITDFGLAKVMGDIMTSNYTQNMQGTLGYMAPELASYGHISRKCDVYSYGILLMELVSGRKPTDELHGEEGKTLVQWVRSMFEANQAVDIVDQRLHEEYNEHEAKVKLLLSVALQCTQENPRKRPTMQQVVQVLLSSSSTSPHAAS